MTPFGAEFRVPVPRLKGAREERGAATSSVAAAPLYFRTLNFQETCCAASRMTRSNVPGATLRKRLFRLSETAMLMVGF